MRAAASVRLCCSAHLLIWSAVHPYHILLVACCCLYPSSDFACTCCYLSPNCPIMLYPFKSLSIQVQLHTFNSSMPCVSTKFIAKSATSIFFFGFAMICGNPSSSSWLMHLCHLAFSWPSCYISSPSGLLSHQHDSTTACRLADVVYLYSHLARFGTSLISSGSKSPKQLSCGGDHLLHRQVKSCTL